MPNEAPFHLSELLFPLYSSYRHAVVNTFRVEKYLLLNVDSEVSSGESSGLSLGLLFSPNISVHWFACFIAEDCHNSQRENPSNPFSATAQTHSKWLMRCLINSRCHSCYSQYFTASLALSYQLASSGFLRWVFSLRFLEKVSISSYEITVYLCELLSPLIHWTLFHWQFSECSHIGWRHQRPKERVSAVGSLISRLVREWECLECNKLSTVNADSQSAYALAEAID